MAIGIQGSADWDSPDSFKSPQTDRENIAAIEAALKQITSLAFLVKNARGADCSSEIEGIVFKTLIAKKNLKELKQRL